MNESPKHYPPVNEKVSVKALALAKAAVDRKALCAEKIDPQFNPAKYQNSLDTFYEKGEFSKEEKNARTEQLAPGVIVRHDVGLNFYRVQKGDNLEGIKAKLSNFPEFAYMKDLPKGKITSFNIQNKFLPCDKWIPLPSPNSALEGLTEAQFLEASRAAVNEMKTNQIYGPLIVDLLRLTTVDEIVAMMLACAKTESGDGSMDRFAPFRYEHKHECFSYSVFHVLMDGPGLKARQNLGMTEGQTLFPKNSAKLFLAFLIEKSPNGFQKYLPLDVDMKGFSTFYNGNWERAAKLENKKIDKRNSKKKKGDQLEPHVLDYPTRLAQNYVKAKAVLRI